MHFDREAKLLAGMVNDLLGRATASRRSWTTVRPLDRYHGAMAATLGRYLTGPNAQSARFSLSDYGLARLTHRPMPGSLRATSARLRPQHQRSREHQCRERHY